MLQWQREVPFYFLKHSAEIIVNYDRAKYSHHFFRIKIRFVMNDE